MLNISPREILPSQQGRFLARGSADSLSAQVRRVLFFVHSLNYPASQYDLQMSCSGSILEQNSRLREDHSLSHPANISGHIVQATQDGIKDVHKTDKNSTLSELGAGVVRNFFSLNILFPVGRVIYCRKLVFR